MTRPLVAASCVILLAALAAPFVGAAARAPVSLLAVEQLVPEHADAAAVHGGGGPGAEREREAVALWRTGRVDRIVAMGGPLPHGDPDVSYAGAVVRRLREVGAPPNAIIPLPEGGSSADELRALSSLAEREGWRVVALVTSRWHSRRVVLLASQVFDGSRIAWYVGVPDGFGFDPDRWWQEPATRRLVIGEWLKIGLALAFPAASGPA